MKTIYPQAIELLKALIQTPSFSEEEDKTAEILSKWLQDFNIDSKRSQNNIWAVNKYFEPKKASVL